MNSFLKNYVNELQLLRVKAGLTIISKNKLLKSLAKDVLITFTMVWVFISAVKLFYDINYLLLFPLILLSVLVSFLTPYLKYKLLVRSRSKLLENEFTYFIISEAITLTGYTELLNDICELSGWESVFPTLFREGLRLKMYRRFLTLFETVNHYIKYVSSDFISRLLGDYLLAVSKGIVSSWLIHSSTELIHKLRVDAKALIRLRATTILVIGVLISYLPTLMVSLSIITGDKGLTSVIELTPVIVVMSVVLLPRNVLHLKIYYNFNTIKKVVTVASYVLMAYVAYHLVIDPYSAKYLMLSVSAIALINGVLGIKKLYEAVNEIHEVPKIMYMFAETPSILINPLKALKDVLSGCRSKSLKELGTKIDLNSHSTGAAVLNSWIGRYTYYVLIKSLINGSLSKEQLLGLRILTMDMLEDFKQYLVGTFPLIMMSLMVPWLMSSMISLANVNFIDYGLYIYLITITYAVYVDYAVFGTASTTLISGIVLLFISLIWVC
ncbi:MAG: hypothetical protein QXO98_03020 [Sulfolobales archaeon]